MFLLLALTAVLYGAALCRTLLDALLRSRSRDALVLLLAITCSNAAVADAVDEAVVMVEGCSGVCVDPAGLVLTAKHCELPTTVTVRFKDRTVAAQRVYVSRDAEGPVVFDCEGDGFPYLTVAASPPQIGERLWSYGYPQVNGRRELRWNSGPLLRWSTFDYGGGSFNGNVVGFVTGPGWSGGPLLNAKAEVCGLLNSTDCATSVFISSAAVRQAYAAVRASRPADPPATTGQIKLYVFGSMTCGPCRKFKEDYANNAPFRQTLDTTFAVEFVDADKQVDLTSQFGVTEVPTFILRGGVRVIGYQGPDDLLVRLGVQQEIAARPPPQRDVVTDAVSKPEPVATTAPAGDVAVDSTPPADTPVTTPVPAPPGMDERLDRLSGLVQTAVSIATWLGVGGATGGAGGLILGGLALWRTLRRRRDPKPARDPPSNVIPPSVVTVENPPPRQAIVPETRFAPYERDTFAEAFAWAESELVRKYPGAVSTLEALKGLINQFLSAKGVKPTK